MLSSPIKVIACVFDLNSGFWRLYTPFLFLPLLDPFLLCTGFLATILYATSNSDTMVHYNQYHGLLLNAILFISLARICQSIHNNNTKLDIYKRIFLTSSKYLQIKKIILLLLIICFPLWGVGFQEFYPIKIKEIRNFEQVKQVLYTNYSHNNICPQENLLPMFLSEPLNITHDGSIFNLKKPCVIVFTTLGDSWPYTKSQIKQEIRKRKNSCGVLGDFYICPNSGI